MRGYDIPLKWLMAIRLAVVILCLVVILIHEAGLAGPSRYGDVYLLLVAVSIINCFYLFFFRLIEHQRRFAVVQVYGDIVFVTGLVYLTGSVSSTFVNLYFAAILAAGMVLSSRASLVVASVATGLHALVCLCYFGLQAGGYAPPLVDPWFLKLADGAAGFMFSYLFAQGVAFHLVAILVNQLAHRLSLVRIHREEILQQMADGVLAMDVGGRIVFVNDRARILLGIKLDEPVVGRLIGEVLATPAGRRVAGLLEEFASRSVETRLVNLYGERIPVEVKTALLREPVAPGSAGGHLRGVIAHLVDLTTRKKMEDATKRADRLEVVQEMAAGIAHEIRNPLSAIRGSVQELARRADLDERGSELMRVVIKESDRLDRIVGDFLEFARMKETVPAPCDVGNAVREVALLLANSVQAAGRVVVDVEGDLTCLADPEQLRQVLYNLGLNALQASGPAGEVAFRSRPHSLLEAVGVDERGREKRRELPGIAMEVEDTGPGVPPEIRDRIFDPFFTTKPGGSGLGLSIVNRILKGHNATIAVEPRDGGGTRVTVWLPKDPATVNGMNLVSPRDVD